MTDLESRILDAWEHRAEISPTNASTELRDAVSRAIELLDSGKARVAESSDDGWKVNEWLKMAVLQITM